MSRLRFGVLGPLEVRDGDRKLSLSPIQRRLVAALLVQPDVVVSTDRLADIAWAGEPPSTARQSLQSHLSRLRNALSDDVIVTEELGYRIAVPKDAIDAARFEELARDARHTDDAARSLAQIEDALALWRGRAWAEFADEDFARPEAVRLEELRLVAIEDRADAALRTGDADRVAADLEAFVLEHPFRERPHAQLMRALYRCGRAGQALEVYRRFRERLADELGVDPSEQLRRLETDILREERSLAPTRTGGAASRRPTRRAVRAGADSLPTADDREPRGNLPAEASSLLGRDRELSELRGRLDQARVLTLTGPGGVGKTRLALRLARVRGCDHRDGAWVCELAPLDDPAAVEHSLARVLGVQPHGSEPLRSAILAALRSRDVLLVLDNCEHVVDAAAAIVTEIVWRCPKVTVLATSREPLGVDGEHTWRVAPLALPSSDEPDVALAAPSVRLFRDRARAVAPAFDVGDENVGEVVDLCRRLDGIPLAIELAAARMGSMSPADVGARLDERFDLIGRRRASDERHRTLEAAIAWSHDLLDADERRFFDRLSVFAGGFTLDAAERVCGEALGEPLDATDLVTALVDRSMVVADHVGRHVRYHVLETFRQFGRRRLVASEEAEDLARAHAVHFVSLAERASHEIAGPSEVPCAELLDRELDNLRAAHLFAVRTRDVDLALRLSSALHFYAQFRMRAEVFTWAETAAEMARGPNHPLLPVALGSAAIGASNRGELRLAERWAREALAAAGGEPSERTCLAMCALSVVALYEGRLADCVRINGDVLEWATRNCASSVAVQRQLEISLAHTYDGHPQRGFAVAEDGIRLADTIGNPSLRAFLRYAAAEALMDSDPEESLRRLEESMALADEAKASFPKGLAMISAASLHARGDDPARALESYLEVVRHWHGSWAWRHLWTSLRSLVDVFSGIGADTTAAVLLGAVTRDNRGAPVFGRDAERLREVESTLGHGLGTSLRGLLERGSRMDDADVISFVEDEIRCALRPGEPIPAP